MPRRCFVFFYEVPSGAQALLRDAPYGGGRESHNLAHRRSREICRYSAKATAPSNQMTLDAVVADVLEHNPELSFYNAEIAAAKGEARTAATWANPELSSTIGDKRVTGSGLAAEGVAWSVSVRQTFEWPGRIPLRKAIANQQIQLAELGFTQFKAALAARTRSVAFGLFAASTEGSGGPRSRRSVSCVARSAGATGPGRNHAGAGTTHYRSDRNHDAPQGQ